MSMILRSTHNCSLKTAGKEDLIVEKYCQQHNWIHGKYSQSPVLCTFHPKRFKIISHVNI